MILTSGKIKEQSERKSNIQVTIQQKRELPHELSLQLENETDTHSLSPPSKQVLRSFIFTEILQYHFLQKLQALILKLPLSKSLIWGPLGAPPYMQVLFSLEHLP